MIYSTNHPQLSLCMLAVCAMTTIAVSGFGINHIIDPSLQLTTMTSNNRGGRRITMRQRITGQLWSSRQEDGDDTTTSCTIVSSTTLTDEKSTSASSTVIIQEETNIQNEKTIDDDDDDRAEGLRKLMESFSGVLGTSDNNNDNRLLVGSTVVVSGLSLPHLGIEDWQSYELVSVYDQGVNDVNGLPIKIPRTDLNEAQDNMIPSGYKRYCTLYSARYHQDTGPVVVSPDEIQLVSVQDEVKDSLLMALPVFGFWTALAVSFANMYNERYGGNFLDALFRTHGL